MYLIAIKIKLKNALKFYSYARNILPAFEEMKQAKGVRYASIKHQSFLEHYIKAAWESEEYWKEFKKSEVYNNATQSAVKSTDGFELIEWPAEAYPTWKEIMEKFNS